MNRRKALVVGIDTYACARLHNLKGCRNDALRMAELLSHRFDFEVARLLDGEASRENILTAMADLLDDLRPDDEVVFFFSGHGSRILSRRVGAIETLVPCDSFRANGPNRDITDREIFGWVMQLSRSTERVTLIIDACRAGGIVRDLEAVPRGVEPDSRGGILEDKIAFLDHQGFRGGLEMYPPVRPGVELDDRYVLVAACESDEFCRETTDPKTGLKHGLLSLYLSRALQSLHEPVSWFELCRELRSAIQTEHARQTLHLEGAVYREIFGVRELRPQPHATVIHHQGRELQLDAGAAHGLESGSAWRLFPVKASEPRAQILGRLTVTRVGASTSEARLTEQRNETTSKSLVGCRAFEERRPLDSRLRVLVDPQSPYTLPQENADLWLQPVESAAEADLVVRHLPPRSSTSSHDPLPGLGPLEKAHVAIVDSTGLSKAPARPWQSSRTARTVTRDLQTLARHRFLARLDHPNPQRSLASRVKAQLLAKPPGSQTWGELIDGDTVPLGSFLGLHLLRTDPASNPENHSPAGWPTLYAAVFDLGLAGAVSFVYPGRGRRIPWQSETLKIGFRADDAMRLDLPPELPFPGEPPFREQEETLVILLTTQWTDFNVWQQPGVGPVRSSGSPVRGILQRALNRPVQRDEPSIDLLAEQASWGVLRCRFRVVVG